MKCLIELSGDGFVRTRRTSRADAAPGLAVVVNPRRTSSVKMISGVLLMLCLLKQRHSVRQMIAPLEIYADRLTGRYTGHGRGASWPQLADADTFGDNPFGRVPEPGNHDLLYVAAYTGVFKSDNGGGSWRRVLQNIPASMQVRCAPYRLAVTASVSARPPVCARRSRCYASISPYRELYSVRYGFSLRE